MIYVFLGKLEFEIIEGIDNGKYKDFVENVMRKQIGGPCISILNKSDDVLMLNQYINPYRDGRVINELI